MIYSLYPLALDHQVVVLDDFYFHSIDHDGNNPQNHIKITHLYIWSRGLTRMEVAKLAECVHSKAENTKGLSLLSVNRNKLILFPVF